MKDIKLYLTESNSVEVFDPSKSKIHSDGKALVGAIYSKDMKLQIMRNLMMKQLL